MEKYNTVETPKSSRITRLVDHLYAKMPVIESDRARLITESYRETEDQPIITRRAKAFAHILHNIPIIIRDEELIVGSNYYCTKRLPDISGIFFPVAGGRAGHSCYQNSRSFLYSRGNEGRTP